MTVKELIEILKTKPKDSEVFFEEEWGHIRIMNVWTDKCSDDEIVVVLAGA